MQSIHSLIILDAAMAVIMIVLALLSKRLGEALKIRPYYRFLYLSVALILIDSFMNAISADVSIAVGKNISGALPNIVRFFAGLIAVAACFRYWKWLFVEYMKK